MYISCCWLLMQTTFAAFARNAYLPVTLYVLHSTIDSVAKKAGHPAETLCCNRSLLGRGGPHNSRGGSTPARQEDQVLPPTVQVHPVTAWDS